MYSFPDQTIPESKKNEDWHAQHVINFVSFTKSGEYRESRVELERLYHAYAAKIHPADKKTIEKMITQRYCNTDLGPAYDVYPLIENTIDQLIGDYRLRPLRLYALTHNPDAITAKLDEMYDMFLEKITRKVHQEIKEEEGLDIPTENPDIELPEEQDEEFFKNYRTKSEEITEKILYMILIIKKEKEKIYQALLHFLIAGKVNMLMVEKDGHPSISVLHPLKCDTDVDPNNVIQDNPQYFAYHDLMSINDIFNTYDLSKAKKEMITGYSDRFSPRNFRGKIDSAWFFKGGNDNELRVNVVTLIWKSRIKQRFLKFINDQGNDEMKIIPEDYKPKNRDKIETIEIENIRHCTMIGPDVVLEFGSQEGQLKAIGSPKKRFIHTLGINNNNRTGQNIVRSVAKKISFLQEYASEVLYEIKLAMRQVDGGVLAYDLANMPKEWMKMGIDGAMEKVNYSLKKDRVLYFNSADKRSTGYASSVNISQKNRIGELTALLALLESLAEKISGLNSAKKGDTADYAKTGVMQMNMLQASARIENIYGPFDTFVEKFLERIVLKAQHFYKKNEVLNYYAGDKSLKFIQISEEFFQDDLGVTLSDPRKELEAKELIDQAAAQMLPNAQDPKMILELIKIHMSDSASDAVSIFERGIEAMQKAAEERQKAEQQAAQEANAVAKEKIEMDATLKREGYENNKDVAHIYAQNKTQSDQIKEVNANLRKAADIETQERKDAREKVAAE